jgi:hypothetical protein
MYRDNEGREVQGGSGAAPEYINKCKDQQAVNNRPTSKTLVRETHKVCELLHESIGSVGQYKEKFNKETELFHHRKCLFVRTEGNYQRYRNLGLFVSTDLIQFSGSIKANVEVYKKGYKDLNDTLKKVAEGAKSLKAKVIDLKEAGSRLYNCVNDDCNKTQRRAITGSAPGCDSGKPGCPGSGDILRELIYTPIGLMQDADILFKSAYEVVGIQTFSNPESFENLHKGLDAQVTKLTARLSEVAKEREGDLKKLQEDMTKSTQNVSKAYLDLNHNRSNFEGYKDAAQFLCRPTCRCGENDKVASEYHKEREKYHNAPPETLLTLPILELCHRDICEICKVVDNTFCCEPEIPPTPPPTKPPSSEC